MRTAGRFAAALVVWLGVAVPGLSYRAADRPPVMGRNAAVSAGHPLTTAAAFETLLKGGNAFDAGVAAMLVGGVVEQDLYSLGGEGLVLVYPRSSRKVISVVGQGWAPKAATIDWYRLAGQDDGGGRPRPRGRPGRAARGAHRARTMGHDEVRAGGGPGDRIRRARLPAAAADGAGDRRESQVHRIVAGQSPHTG